MDKRNKKYIIIIIILIGIILLNVGIIFGVRHGKKIVENETKAKNNSNGVNDVVNTIMDLDYQSITSLIEEDGAKAYIIVDAQNGSLENSMDKLLDIANEANIKLTFIENDDIANKSKPYFEKIEENGHTVLPNYLNLQHIFNKNNVKIIEKGSGIEQLEKQDVAFYIKLDKNSKIKNENLNEKFPVHIRGLKEQGYKFKAFV